ncbi:hypothetical protein LCO01nite_11080 [Lapidilactobacillus concavus]|nr:hypothetical protein LCO01nite_11080 [Lapidilactobacillus concavus]
MVVEILVDSTFDYCRSIFCLDDLVLVFDHQTFKQEVIHSLKRCLIAKTVTFNRKAVWKDLGT